MDDHKSEASFGTTKNYLVATVAGFFAGPLFLLSPFAMFLLEKGKASKHWSTKTKWIAWGLTGVIICPVSWAIQNGFSEADNERAAIAARVDELSSTEITGDNYRQVNARLTALLHDACYSSEKVQCTDLDSGPTQLNKLQRDKLKPVLSRINKELNDDKARRSLEEATRRAQVEKESQAKEKEQHQDKLRLVAVDSAAILREACETGREYRSMVDNGDAKPSQAEYEASSYADYVSSESGVSRGAIYKQVQKGLWQDACY